MSTRFQIASMIFMMLNAVVFGIGIVTVLAVPTLSDLAFGLIPAVVLISFAISAPLSWMMAPMLRARYERRRSLAVQPR
ncbi:MULTISPECIES: hypothetical protein [Rhodopseudomonas]|uniref:Uncharacterized protein n=1 Tax=Rhodopseudomonas palustris TaxID=1076 RepID=A0A0D7EJJ0_RHOPL|nr:MULTISPECIES: hypothetical protein [Rhodopseudomonas]KIZ40953.1 hypothetical protein OO17_16290 [Rhodopseudomonas palustris]MDF3813579.1 hypothetical protein [Rhodopseudomonas sp. BAL398]WOK15648.1 hypothetical protein RBJ75_15830 [Rhodopseudomonas sp. BAL398]